MAGPNNGRQHQASAITLLLSIATVVIAGASVGTSAPSGAAEPPSGLYVVESQFPGGGQPAQSAPGGIERFDPTDLGAGAAATYQPLLPPIGAAGFRAAVMVGTSLVGLDTGQEHLVVFNSLNRGGPGQDEPLPPSIGPVEGMAVSPNGTELYLVSEAADGLEVSEVSTFTWATVSTHLLTLPWGINLGETGTIATPTVDPTTGDLWIPLNGGVLVVDPSNWTQRTIPTAKATGQVAFAAGEAWIPDGTSLTAVSTASLVTVTTVALNPDVIYAAAAVAAPDGSTVYVGSVELGTDYNNGGSAFDVTAVPTSGGGLIDFGWAANTINLTVSSMAISADGGTVYVGGNTALGAGACGIGFVTAVDTTTGTDDSIPTAPGGTTCTPNVTALVTSPSAPPPTQGYWQVAQDGGVFAFGDAGFYGSMGGKPLNASIVGLAATPGGSGYWEVAGDGGVFAFGTAGFYGSMGGKPLNAPIVGLAATPDGKGYWEVAGDGGVFAFGDAGFYGSMGGKPLNASIVGLAATPDGKGYWEVARDGGVFAFGDARFEGSMGGTRLVGPVVGMAPDAATGGYWLVASDAGVFAFDAPFLGSATGSPVVVPVEGITAAPGDSGYWLFTPAGQLDGFGTAGNQGSAYGLPLTAAVTGMAVVTGSA